MEITAVAQLRRMVLEHLARYTWEDRLKESVYDILQEVREDTPRYRCCVYKERAVLKKRKKKRKAAKNGRWSIRERKLLL